MNIIRELPVPPIQPTLDDIPYQISDDELAFLKQAVSPEPEEIKRRAETVRKDAYSLYPYPCIRRYHFLNLMMLFNPVYPSVVDAGRKGVTWFLDIGCCMGTDVRKLVLDGYHAANVAACDLRSTFIDIGRDKERGLFRDADHCEITFFAADILELSLSRSGPGEILDHLKPTLRETASSILSAGGTLGLEHLKGRMTHVYTGALFHLFDEETQYAIALRVALLLDLGRHGDKKKDSGSKVIFGRHQGKEEAGVIDDDMGRWVKCNTAAMLLLHKIIPDPVHILHLGPFSVRYGHNAGTWTRMWQRVFTELEGEDFVRKRVFVQAEFIQNHAGRPGHKWFVWSVTIN